MRGVFRSERSGKPRISKPKTKGVRGVRLFLWGRQAGQSRAVALPFRYFFFPHRYRPGAIRFVFISSENF